MTNAKFDVAIAGGGIAGLTLACRLGRAGLRVVVLEAGTLAAGTETPAPSCRTAAIMQDGIAVLDSAGVWEACRPHSGALSTMSLLDDPKGFSKPVRADFHADEAGLEAFGYNIPLSVLRHALIRQVQTLPAVTLFDHAALTGMEPGAAEITLTCADGRTVQASLAVAADGRESVLRTLAGIGVRDIPCDQSALTCLIAHTRPHNDTSLEFHRPGGPFTLVPLPGDNASVVWVERRADAEKMLHLSREDFTAELQERTQDTLGSIQLTSGPECWPLDIRIAKALTAPRLALTAEAAHVVHPIGAQGLNISLQDVRTLADLLVEAKKLGLDPGSSTLLARYERARRADTMIRVALTSGFNGLVSQSLRLPRLIRRCGLTAVRDIPLFRRLAMKIGLGAPG